VVKKEIDFFKATGEKGVILKKISGALQTIPPTSVESERAFSAAGNFANKVRSRLKAETLSKMCLLRSYFQQA